MTAKELDIVRDAAKITTEIMWQLREFASPGVTGAEFDQYTGQLCANYKVLPAFKGVPSKKGPFPGNLCLSINNEILHGIPSAAQVFKPGDLISIDFGIIHQGYYTDNCITVGLKELTIGNEKLLRAGQLAVFSAVKKVKAGIRTGVLGNTMQSVIELAGFHVVKQYSGHGIGKTLWRDPEVPAWGPVNAGQKLKVGQVICIEAQAIAGTDKIETGKDGWTIVSKDGSSGVMFEYMAIVTETGYELLTPTQDWELLK